jgi:hypothetical protein
MTLGIMEKERVRNSLNLKGLIDLSLGVFRLIVNS